MKKVLFFLIFTFFTAFLAVSEKTPVKSLEHFKLENGLSLFVAENHSVPLTYIEVAVRCGSYTQNKETAGLFHLYEHMMFKGNSLYKDAASVNRALSDMGVAEWNGTTGLECVNYYFTVPSDMTEKGLEFWASAIQSPLMDKKEFEAEKKVVISEINGSASDPSQVYLKAKSDLLFSDAPYTMTPSGTEDSIKNATIKHLKDIQKKYYIPNNCAVFVGGDVSPSEVYIMVKKIFGTWKKGKDPFEKGMIKHSYEPFNKTECVVMPYNKISEEFAQIIVDFRGPDAFYDKKDTFAADILSDLINNPSGLFRKTFTNDSFLGVPDSDCVGGSYLTRKTCGITSFYALVVQAEEEGPNRALYFKEKIANTLNQIVENLTDESLKEIAVRLEDENIISSQTATGLLSSLRFWWTVCDEDYYYSYNKNMSSVTKEDLAAFIKKYIEGKNPLVSVLVNPEVYKKTKTQFVNAGFREIK